ncbi:adenylate/guanylate cyclase domain-containing protein [Persephonella sp.]|uniref:adenylate/guanylate cyclase domain-containing protein n=1 Tax=Persephonella sp. TaxID=2060922 RepID=UPI00263733AA|nr:adenylate/guanylate cyclase domain-containing protein [Persephonella sp.]
MELWGFFEKLKEKLSYLENIRIETYNTIEQAINNAKVEKPIWNRVDNVVVVLVDLKNSTQISNRKTKRVYAKFLEYTGYPFVKISKSFGSEFIDIKGDGGISLFSGEYAEIKAFLAAKTFKTFQEEYVREKFKNKYGVNLSFGIGISKGDLLVKLIGQRGDDKFFVWAGNAINNAALISKNVKRFSNKTVIGIDENIYNVLNQEKFKNYLVISCGCLKGENISPWKKYYTKKKSNFKYYKIESDWCKKHGEKHINAVLKIIENY